MVYHHHFICNNCNVVPPKTPFSGQSQQAVSWRDSQRGTGAWFAIGIVQQDFCQHKLVVNSSGVHIAAVSGVIESRNFGRDNKNSFEVNRCSAWLQNNETAASLPKEVTWRLDGEAVFIVSSNTCWYSKVPRFPRNDVRGFTLIFNDMHRFAPNCGRSKSKAWAIRILCALAINPQATRDLKCSV